MNIQTLRNSITIGVYYPLVIFLVSLFFRSNVISSSSISTTSPTTYHLVYDGLIHSNVVSDYTKHVQGDNDNKRRQVPRILAEMLSASIASEVINTWIDQVNSHNSDLGRDNSSTEDDFISLNSSNQVPIQRRCYVQDTDNDVSDAKESSYNADFFGAMTCNVDHLSPAASIHFHIHFYYTQHSFSLTNICEENKGVECFNYPPAVDIQMDVTMSNVVDDEYSKKVLRKSVPNINHVIGFSPHGDQETGDTNTPEPVWFLTRRTSLSRSELAIKTSELSSNNKNDEL